MAIESADQIIVAKPLDQGKVLLLGRTRNRVEMILCGAKADGTANLNVQTVFAAGVADRIPEGALKGLFHHTIHTVRDFHQMSFATEDNLDGSLH